MLCASNCCMACFVAYVTTGACWCSSCLGSFSMMLLMEASEARETQQKPLLWPLARFSKNLTSMKSETPAEATASWMSWSVVHQVRLPT